MIKKFGKTAIIIIFVSIFLLGIILSFFIGYNYNNPTQNKKIENHESGFKYISPLLECENSLPLNYNYSKLKTEISNLIEAKISSKDVGTISLYFRDLNNGPWIGINEKDEFSPASLLKVPLMIAYLKLAEGDSTLLAKKLVVGNYQTDMYPNILPAKTATPGLSYTIDELLTYMIEYSDNSAANTLLANIPENDLANIYTDFNLKVPGSGDTENFMTVTEYSSFFRILYNASYLNRDMSEKALEMLALSQFNQGIKSGLPSNIKVADKFGERIFNDTKQLHDCGIIYLNNNNNYLLCVMTKGDDFKKMETTISDISNSIYTRMLTFTK